MNLVNCNFGSFFQMSSVTHVTYFWFKIIVKLFFKWDLHLNKIKLFWRILNLSLEAIFDECQVHSAFILIMLLPTFVKSTMNFDTLSNIVVWAVASVNDYANIVFEASSSAFI